MMATACDHPPSQTIIRVDISTLPPGQTTREDEPHQPGSSNKPRRPLSSSHAADRGRADVAVKGWKNRCPRPSSRPQSKGRYSSPQFGARSDALSPPRGEGHRSPSSERDDHADGASSPSSSRPASRADSSSLHPSHLDNTRPSRTGSPFRRRPTSSTHPESRVPPSRPARRSGHSKKLTATKRNSFIRGKVLPCRPHSSGPSGGRSSSIRTSFRHRSLYPRPPPPSPARPHSSRSEKYLQVPTSPSQSGAADRDHLSPPGHSRPDQRESPQGPQGHGPSSKQREPSPSSEMGTSEENGGGGRRRYREGGRREANRPQSSQSRGGWRGEESLGGVGGGGGGGRGGGGGSSRRKGRPWTAPVSRTNARRPDDIGDSNQRPWMGPDQYSDETKRKQEEIIRRILEEFDLEETMKKYRNSNVLVYRRDGKSLADFRFRSELIRMMGSEEIHLNDQDWSRKFGEKLKEDYNRLLDEQEHKLAEAEKKRLHRLRVEGVITAGRDLEEFGPSHGSGSEYRVSMTPHALAHTQAVSVKRRSRTEPAAAPKHRSQEEPPHSKPVFADEESNRRERNLLAHRQENMYYPSEDVQTQMDRMEREEKKRGRGFEVDHKQGQGSESLSCFSSMDPDGKDHPYAISTFSSVRDWEEEDEQGRTMRRRHPKYLPRCIARLYEEETTSGLYDLAAELLGPPESSTDDSKNVKSVTIA